MNNKSKENTTQNNIPHFQPTTASERHLSYSFDYDASRNTTSIEFNVPVTIYFGGERDELNAIKMIKEEIRLMRGAFVKQIKGDSFELSGNEANNPTFVLHAGELIYHISQLMEGFASLEEELDMRAERLRNERDEISDIPHFVAPVRQSVKANQARARATIAFWLAAKFENGDEEMQKIVGNILTELELESGEVLNSGEHITQLLDFHAKRAKEQGEISDDIETVLNRLSKLSTDSSKTPEFVSEAISTFSDELLNPNAE